MPCLKQAVQGTCGRRSIRGRCSKLNLNTDILQCNVAMQACDLVPIVEPEILIDGDYDMHRSSAVSQEVLQVRQTAIPHSLVPGDPYVPDAAF